SVRYRPEADTPSCLLVRPARHPNIIAMGRQSMHDGAEHPMEKRPIAEAANADEVAAFVVLQADRYNLIARTQVSFVIAARDKFRPCTQFRGKIRRQREVGIE